MRFRYIAVEGSIGVGKTSLVDLMGTKLDAIKVFEDANNPFLNDFYKDKEGVAFQTQLFFLLSRYRQQQKLLQQNLFRQLTICDYLFAKDKIFAYLNLSDSELMIYEKLYSIFQENVPKPDLVIYLQATTEVLKKRIAKRGRSLERDISEDYLEEVNQAFNYFFFNYNERPLLVVNTSAIDFVEKEEALDDLIEQVKKMGKGTQFYVPLGSR
ncbi:deoxynucleoside kinase [bacterium (candidate division B38) B3_B38]|nr:MAG: deoxynucleoside kinase [bacterium (candidate division B38) B3_B38]